MEKYDIFISYRRTSFKTANLVAQRLKNAGFRVFLDTDEMHSGKFDKQLYRHIENCKDFVLILSPEALDRCSDESDWVRHEIMHAIACKKNIIPLLLQGFEWPAQMPKGMQDLNMYQSLSVDDKPEQYNWAIDQLSTRYLASKKKSNTLSYIAVTIAVLALTGVAFLLLNKSQDNNTVNSDPKTTIANDSITTTVTEEQHNADTIAPAPVAETVSTTETDNQVTAIKTSAEEEMKTITIDEKHIAGINEMKAGNGKGAIKLFEESGSAASLYKIGEIYNNGCGTVEKNAMKAEQYFKKAKKLGYEP